MGTPEQKETLASLEDILANQILEKLNHLVNLFSAGKFLIVNKKRCPLHHIDEMVKLAHKARSIMNPVK